MAIKNDNKLTPSTRESISNAAANATKANDSSILKNETITNSALSKVTGGSAIMNAASNKITVALDGKVELYNHLNINKFDTKEFLAVSANIDNEDERYIERTIKSPRKGNTYVYVIPSLKNTKILGITVYSKDGIIDVLSQYTFDLSTGKITFTIKVDAELTLLSLITIRVYYKKLDLVNNLVFVDVNTSYKKNYKILGHFTMDEKKYDLTDVSGMAFTPYNGDQRSLVTTPANGNRNNTVGIYTTYMTNPYDVGQWVEKRVIYYIPSDFVNPYTSLTSSTVDILSSTSGTAFFKRNGFIQDNSILNNISYNNETILLPSSINNAGKRLRVPPTFQATFRDMGYYEADAIGKLRGNIVPEEVFYTKRKQAMHDSLKELMLGNNEDYSLVDEFINENGKDRIYNFAKGFSNMINQEALNVKDDITIKRTLQDISSFSYQAVFEKKIYDSTIVDKVNNATDEEKKTALLNYMKFSPFGNRELIERLAQSSDFPLEKLFEENSKKQMERDAASNYKEEQFIPERNAHLKYYNTTKPALDNIIKDIYSDKTYDIAKNMLYNGFDKLFFNDLYTFKEINSGILDRAASVDTTVPKENTSVSYKVVYSNSEEESDELDTLILGLIKPSDGTKLEVYNGE